jgi:LmbE family N-acetylglucosaminyl deacetylase
VNVLAFGAHPDDIELYCAGTLAKYARDGHPVTMAVICSGDSGYEGLPPKEVARMREEESCKAAAIIGATTHHLRYSDHQVPTDDTIKQQISEIIRSASPVVLITHDPNDCFVDHVRTSELVEECLYMARDRTIVTSYPAAEGPVVLFYMDTVAGLGFQPQEFVDITDVFETKRRMVECHESQIVQWKDHPALDTMEMMEVTARFRGLQVGVRYAEVFRRADKWDRTFHERLLP